MIVFDLGCGNGHVFEAWFGSTGDYEAQRARGLVTCPICESPHVDKAVMAPRIGRKSSQQPQPPAPTARGMAVPMASDGPAPEQIKAMLTALAEAQSQMLKQSDWVGDRFAQEARAMHVGDTEQRAIYGQTTAEQAKDLIDDGIPVAPLPFPVRPPGADN